MYTGQKIFSIKCRRVCREEGPLLPTLSPGHSAPSSELTYDMCTFSGVTSACHCWLLEVLIWLSFLLHCWGCRINCCVLPVSPSSVSLPCSDFDPWWTNDREQNESDPIPANCTGCAQKLPLKVVLLEDAPKEFERLHPLVIKVREKLILPLTARLMAGPHQALWHSWPVILCCFALLLFSALPDGAAPAV